MAKDIEQICDKCLSSEVARCKWVNVNTDHIYDADSGTYLEWCFDCNDETTIAFSTNERSVDDVEKTVHGYSAEKMADELISSSDNVDVRFVKEVWKSGFNAHKELVKDKLFTAEDIEEAMNQGLTIDQFWEKYCKSLPQKHRG